MSAYAILIKTMITENLTILLSGHMNLYEPHLLSPSQAAGGGSSSSEIPLTVPHAEPRFTKYTVSHGNELPSAFTHSQTHVRTNYVFIKDKQFHLQILLSSILGTSKNQVVLLALGYLTHKVLSVYGTK